MVEMGRRVRKADPPKRGLRPAPEQPRGAGGVRKADPPKRGLRRLLSRNMTVNLSEKQTRQKGD